MFCVSYQQPKDSSQTYLPTCLLAWQAVPASDRDLGLTKCGGGEGWGVERKAEEYRKARGSHQDTPAVSGDRGSRRSSPGYIAPGKYRLRTQWRRFRCGILD